MLKAGFAEMDLAVDDARQHMQPACVDCVLSLGAAEIADFYYVAADDTDIGMVVTDAGDYRAAADDEIEVLCHGRSLPCSEPDVR